MSHLMDYGPDWPPPPEPRQRIFGRAFWLDAAMLVAAFLLIAVPTVISDHLPVRLNYPVTSATATPHSHHT